MKIAIELPDNKKDYIRVSFSPEQIAAARELGKVEHAGVAQICRRALQTELDRMRTQQSQKAWRQKRRDQGK